MSAKKWALVTGASHGGIGDALVQEFHRRGVKVIATARDTTKLRHLNDIAGIETVELDVASVSSISAAVKAANQITGGKLHFLINNSGVGYCCPLMDSETTQAVRMFSVNVFAIVAVTQAFLPLLRAAEGTVVNNSSVAGCTGWYIPMLGWYDASKAAVNSLSNCMRVELAPLDVKVVNVITGNIKSKFWDNVGGAVLKEGSPYWPIKQQVEQTMNGKNIPLAATDSETFARQVVGDVMKTNPSAWIWRGSLATFAWIASTFVPYWLLDLGLSPLPGLDKLKGLLQQEEAKKER